MSADKIYIILETTGRRVVIRIQPENDCNKWYWACDDAYKNPHESPTGWGKSVSRAAMDYLMSIGVLHLEKEPEKCNL